MASGPYQSNLFRFVIGQYRQGLERHRQAVRGARATVTLGAALPVYALLSICQLAGRKLRQYGLSSRLFGSQAGVANLLDFSDFDQHLVPQEMRNALVVDCETCAAAERGMAQMLMMVGACLDPLQVKMLLTVRSATNDPAAGRITGIASDLETRSLVLVKGHTLVWSGLSAAQQTELQAQMGQCAIARPTRSFWVEVLRVLMWLQRRYRSKATAALPSQLTGLPPASPELSALPRGMAKYQKIIRPELKMPSRVIAASSSSSRSLAGRSALGLATETESDGDHLLYLDADAVATGYVEHPLEKLLKWVDRLLLWVEKQYRAVRLWLSQQRSLADK